MSGHEQLVIDGEYLRPGGAEFITGHFGGQRIEVTLQPSGGAFGLWAKCVRVVAPRGRRELHFVGTNFPSKADALMEVEIELRGERSRYRALLDAWPRDYFACLRAGGFPRNLFLHGVTDVGLALRERVQAIHQREGVDHDEFALVRVEELGEPLPLPSHVFSVVEPAGRLGVQVPTMRSLLEHAWGAATFGARARRGERGKRAFTAYDFEAATVTIEAGQLAGAWSMSCHHPAVVPRSGGVMRVNGQAELRLRGFGRVVVLEFDGGVAPGVAGSWLSATVVSVEQVGEVPEAGVLDHVFVA